MIDGHRNNYQQIAADHIAHWRVTGTNPWQDEAHMEAVGVPTAALIEKYSKPGDLVLDGGCGMGELLLRVPDDRVRYGCDFAEGYVEIAKSRGINAIVADLEALPYLDEKFAVVALVDVLEHVLDLNRVLRETLRVLQPGGSVVVRVPDSEDLWKYLTPEYPYHWAHLRRFDEPGLRLLFDRVFGLQMLDLGIVNHELIAAARKP